MKTTCEMVMDSLLKMKQHLYSAHNMRPDFHITVTHECKQDLLDDPNYRTYMPLIRGHTVNAAIGGHGFTVVQKQDMPYRIWIAGKLH